MRRPLVFWALCLAGGVLAAGLRSFPACVLLAAALFVICFVVRKRFAPGFAAFAAAGALLVVVGAWRMAPYYEPRAWPEIPEEDRWGAAVTLTGTVVRFPDYRPGKVRVLLADVELEGDLAVPEYDPRILVSLIGDEPGVEYGDRIRLRAYVRRPVGYRNPGGFDYARFLRLEGADATAVPIGTSRAEVLESGLGNPLLRGVAHLRARIRAVVDTQFGVAEKEIIKALVLGEKNRLPEALQETYRATGLAHILAISGFHVGIVAAIAYLLFWLLLTRSERLILRLDVHKLAAVLTLVPTVLYVLLAGMRISTIRAGIMIGAFLMALVIDRERDVASAVALAALSILLVDPTALFGASFQLSFAAVIGIFVVLERLDAHRRAADAGEPSPWSWRRGVVWYLAVSVAANLATMPITAATFNRVSPIGLVANPILVPVMTGVGIPLVLLGTVSVFIYEPLAASFYYAALLVFRGVGHVLERLADVPGAWFYLPTPSLAEVVAVYLLLVSLLYARRSRWARAGIATACLLGVASFFYIRAERGLDADYRAGFLDVGQGDSTLVELNTGEGLRTVLVDGGGVEKGEFDVGRAVVAPVLWHRRLSRIDLVVATHGHPDHYDGLRFICRHFEVGEFWWNGVRPRDRRFDELTEILRERGIPARIATAETVPLDRALASVRVVFPSPEFADPASPFRRWNENDRSLVLRIDHPVSPLLLSGDAEADLESWLVENRAADIRAPVIKIGHHAGRTSATADFLRAASPHLAVVSVGRYNVYRAPDAGSIRRLEESAARVLRTDRCGRIEVTVRGAGVSVETMEECGANAP